MDAQVAQDALERFASLRSSLQPRLEEVFAVLSPEHAMQQRLAQICLKRVHDLYTEQELAGEEDESAWEPITSEAAGDALNRFASLQSSLSPRLEDARDALNRFASLRSSLQPRLEDVFAILNHEHAMQQHLAKMSAPMISSIRKRSSPGRKTNAPGNLPPPTPRLVPTRLKMNIRSVGTSQRRSCGYMMSISSIWLRGRN